METEGREFDLRHEGQAADRLRFAGRVFVGGLGAFLVVVGLGLLLAVWRLNSVEAIGLASLAFAPGIALIVSVATAKWRGSIDRIRVDNKGLQVHFDDGTHVEMFWIETSFGITFRDYSPDRWSTKRRKLRIEIFLPQKDGIAGYATREVVQAVLDMARSCHVPAAVGEATVVRPRERPRRVLMTRIGANSP